MLMLQLTDCPDRTLPRSQDLDTQRVPRRHDQTSARLIQPRVALNKAGPVGSADDDDVVTVSIHADNGFDRSPSLQSPLTAREGRLWPDELFLRNRTHSWRSPGS